MRTCYEIFQATSDDWYPCYQLKRYKLVKVSCFELCGGEGWRVCVWGADDCGMERDWPTWQGQFPAFQMFMEIIRQPEISKQWLLDAGFVRA